MIENNSQVEPEMCEHIEQRHDEEAKAPESAITWVKAHKKALVTVGITLCVGGLVFLGIKNSDKLKAQLISIEKSVKKVPPKVPEVRSATRVATPKVEAVASSIANTAPKEALVVSAAMPELETVVTTRTYTAPTVAFDVRWHFRTLPEGCHHSAEKAAEAAALGIELKPNQTLVDSYTKGAA